MIDLGVVRLSVYSSTVMVVLSVVVPVPVVTSVIFDRSAACAAGAASNNATTTVTRGNFVMLDVCVKQGSCNVLTGEKRAGDTLG